MSIDTINVKIRSDTVDVGEELGALATAKAHTTGPSVVRALVGGRSLPAAR